MTGGHFGEWRKLPVSLTELCINTTLRCGQSFRWRKSDEGIWSCVLRGRLISLRQDSTHLHYRSIYSPSVEAPLTPPKSVASEVLGDSDDTEELLKSYFNLNYNLAQLYEQWSNADSNFKKKAPKFTGVRILRQDAWEALIGFICSSNNNIARIMQMVEKLCIHYGPLVGHIDDKPYHDLPTPAALTGSRVEGHLRELGFGYRAKYLHQTAVMIANGHETGWLDTLRNPENPALGTKPKPGGEMKEQGRDGYRAAHEQLLELQGVGPKVADCVCLMGLGWSEALPVDTHMWQIAQRDYKFGKGKHSSLTKATYDAIGNHFRNLWGKEAGWAHSVLFTANLRTFAEQLAAKVELKEETKVKVEGEETAVMEDTISTSTVLRKRVKDQFEDEKNILEIADVTMSTSERVKRRRRG